ncbi:MAG: D-glycero-beta-D-manno-heptose 1-phosphate adenylyltransferase [Armatimonadetes bacterium]|nr:D-glycero-beta-D-manno-heptose 1-phosphate adenylyltransferase [Armatimonadota bacterium]
MGKNKSLDLFLEEARRRGDRIVFTNGCFDLLHAGHVFCLEEARGFGDVLIVGLNSDDSVRRLKGAGRPIFSRKEREKVLSALACVDFVVPFDEETPVNLIREIRPHVHVKGGDYSPEDLPETPLVRELGGEVRIVRYLPGWSTTEVIQRIKESL